MWQCSQQHENRDEAKFCNKCGEKRVMPARCAACGATLQTEDEFCTACGHRREGEPHPVTPVPVLAPVTAAEPVRVDVPAPALETVVSDPLPAASKPEHEPVTFSFGGATIAMKDDSRPDTAKPAVRRKGLSPALTAILSFALFAAVLWLALYFVTR
jgi:hypothetical protein